MPQHPLAPDDVVDPVLGLKVLQAAAVEGALLGTVAQVLLGLLQELGVLLDQVHGAKVAEEEVLGDAADARTAVEGAPVAGARAQLEKKCFANATVFFWSKLFLKTKE